MSGVGKCGCFSPPYPPCHQHSVTASTKRDERTFKMMQSISVLVAPTIQYSSVLPSFLNRLVSNTGTHLPCLGLLALSKTDTLPSES